MSAPGGQQESVSHLGVLDEQNGDVDARRQPAVLLALEVEVLRQVHDGGEGQGAFVESLQEVGEDHNAEDAVVDEAFEAGVFGGGDGDCLVFGVFGDFGLWDLLV